MSYQKLEIVSRRGIRRMNGLEEELDVAHAHEVNSKLEGLYLAAVEFKFKKKLWMIFTMKIGEIYRAGSAGSLSTNWKIGIQLKTFFWKSDLFERADGIIDFKLKWTLKNGLASVAIKHTVIAEWSAESP